MHWEEDPWDGEDDVDMLYLQSTRSTILHEVGLLVGRVLAAPKGTPQRHAGGT